MASPFIWKCGKELCISNTALMQNKYQWIKRLIIDDSWKILLVHSSWKFLHVKMHFACLFNCSMVNGMNTLGKKIFVDHLQVFSWLSPSTSLLTFYSAQVLAPGCENNKWMGNPELYVDHSDFESQHQILALEADKLNTEFWQGILLAWKAITVDIWVSGG